MADNAISGINPYLMSANSALMNDPYFLAAYKSPNYYQLAAAQTQQGQTADQTINTTAATAPQQQVTQPQTAEKSSHKGLAAGLILTAGATALCFAAHGKGNKKLDLIPRIGDGLKNMWKSVTKTVGEKLGNTAETFQVVEKNGKKVCQIPGRTNRLYGENLVEDLGKIGQTAEVRPLMNKSGTAFAEGSNLLRYTFNDKGLEITVVKGKLKRITKDGKNVTAQYTNSVKTEDINLLKQIEEKIAKYNKGENIADLKGIRYMHTENGVSSLYSITKAGDEPKLISVVTKDFAIDSPAVNLYKSNNPAAEKILQENIQ